jgi:hypothetical protein
VKVDPKSNRTEHEDEEEVVDNSWQHGTIVCIVIISSKCDVYMSDRRIVIGYE